MQRILMHAVGFRADDPVDFFMDPDPDTDLERAFVNRIRIQTLFCKYKNIFNFVPSIIFYWNSYTYYMSKK